MVAASAAEGARASRLPVIFDRFDGWFRFCLRLTEELTEAENWEAAG